MASLFLACAILGGIVVVLQFALALLGHDGDHEFGHDAADGFQLLSVRSLAATVAFFGIAGRAMLATGTGVGLSTVVAALVGALAGGLVALSMHALRGMESDGAVRIGGAVGLPARVHVSVPSNHSGVGKVLVTLQNRQVELRAVTAREALPSGTPVIVVDVVDPDTVEVTPTPDLELR
jgi:hypothetical protein